MDMEKIPAKIPPSLWSQVSEKLVDLVLNSQNAAKMPSSLAKALLYLSQKDQSASEVGLQRLLEASTLLEPEKTVAFMEELGLKEVADMLKGGSL